jgi:hypothetical protein
LNFHSVKMSSITYFSFVFCFLFFQTKKKRFVAINGCLLFHLLLMCVSNDLYQLVSWSTNSQLSRKIFKSFEIIKNNKRQTNTDVRSNVIICKLNDFIKCNSVESYNFNKIDIIVQIINCPSHLPKRTKMFKKIDFVCYTNYEKISWKKWTLKVHFIICTWNWAAIIITSFETSLVFQK